MVNYVHMCTAIPPKYPVASVMGFLNRKSAIVVARQLCSKKRDFSGSIFGLGDMQYPPLVLNSIRSANTSAAKKKRMDQEGSSKSR